MQERGWGYLLICASSGLIAPIPNLALSNFLRASLIGWSKTLAPEAARQEVTVIVPGRIATDRIVMLDSAVAAREGVYVETVIAQSLASIPAGRYGEPEEVAKVATFLTSEAASYVAGSIVRVDGGVIGSTGWC